MPPWQYGPALSNGFLFLGDGSIRASADALKQCARLGDHVAEELRLLGVSEERELKSRLIVLVCHLLRWAYQPAMRSRFGTNTIASKRLALEDHLVSNPGLKPKLPDAFIAAYARARLEASSETDLDLDVFPRVPPFDYSEVMDEDWLPEAATLA